MVRKIFEWYVTATYSAEESRERPGRTAWHSARAARCPMSSVHKILRNRIYTGEFDWNGKRYNGTHEPIVAVELWDRVQAVLGGRYAEAQRKAKRDFAFSGLIPCGALRLRDGGGDQEERYVYYHCTGSPTRREIRPLPAPLYPGGGARGTVRRTARPAALRRRGAGLGAHALRASHADEKREHEEAIRRIQAEYDRLQDRIDAMYVDKLDGVVDAEFFERSNGVARRAGEVPALDPPAPGGQPDPTWTRASVCSNWRKTPGGCSISRSRAKNGACSTSYYRTAPGRTALMAAIPPTV